MNNLLEKAKNISVEFLESLNDRRVYPDEESLQLLKMYSEELPLNPFEPEAVILHLHKYGSSSAVASADSRYFGFVNGGSLLASLAANSISSAWDQNAGLGVTSPVNVAIETITSNWLTEILPLHKMQLRDL